MALFAAEFNSPDWFDSAIVAFMILMQNILSHIIIQTIEILKFQLLLLETLFAHIVISFFSSFVSFGAYKYFLFAFITFNNINPLLMHNPKLIPK